MHSLASKRTLRTVLLAAALALVLAACSDGEERAGAGGQEGAAAGQAAQGGGDGAAGSGTSQESQGSPGQGTGQGAGGSGGQQQSGSGGGSTATKPGYAPPEVVSLYTRADKSLINETFTATYRYTRPGGFELRSKLTQAPPRYRFEVEGEGEHVISVYDGELLHLCQPKGSSWSCKKTTTPDDTSLLGPAHPGTQRQHFMALTPHFGYSMNVETASQTVRGRKLDCAVIKPAPNYGGKMLERRLCLTKEGIVGLVVMGDEVLELLELKPTADAKSFTPPR